MTAIGTVLVTGGAGFIGCALSQALAGSAERWVALDSLHPQVHADPVRPTALHPKAELVVADVTDRLKWDELLADVRPDVVIHLAAETGTAQSLDESTRHAAVNVVGTTTMLDAFSAAGRAPSRIVLAGSRAVYGEGDWLDGEGRTFQPGMRSHRQLAAAEWDFAGATPLASRADRTPTSPTSVYGATKLAQEHILRAWSGSRDIGLTVLRLQNVYGPGQSLTNPYTGIVSLFSQIARRGEVIPVYEDGRITRDFVFIDDVVSAFAAVFGATNDRALDECFDVGLGVPHTIMELASAIAEFHGAPAPVVNGAFRDGDVRHSAADVDLTVEGLGWRPEWSLERGVAALQEWIDSRA